MRSIMGRDRPCHDEVCGGMRIVTGRVWGGVADLALGRALDALLPHHLPRPVPAFNHGPRETACGVG